MSPAIAEQIAETNTAAAAKSLVFLASSWYSGETRFVKDSMAVFTNSQTNTDPIHNVQIIHSKGVMENIKPATVTATQQTSSNLKLGSETMAYRIPEKQYINDLKNLFIG